MHESLRSTLLRELYELVEEVLVGVSLPPALVSMGKGAIDLVFVSQGEYWLIVSCPLLSGSAGAVLRCLHGVRVVRGFMTFSIEEYV